MEQNDKRYNGWTNYETWATALWLDNDQGSQNYWREVAREVRGEAAKNLDVQQGHWTAGHAANGLLAARLRQEVTDSTPETIEASLYADLLGAALRRVNWWEIADHWLDDLGD